jgi:hypothetical protein
MLDALGDIGDFLGGIGVVVTLLYLAAQIRQNTLSSRTESYQAAVTSISDWSLNVWVSPDSARVIHAGLFDMDTLGPTERARFSALMSAQFRNYENVHYQYVSGVIARSLWLGFERRIAGMLSLPGVQTWWSEQKYAHSDEFQSAIDNLEPIPSKLEPPTV